MARPKKSEEIGREQLLECALEEFSANGYQSTKLESIAKRAEVSRGALYWHFKNKEDVFLELVRYVGGEIEEQLQNVVTQISSPTEKLKALFKTHFKLLETNPRFRKIKFLECRKLEAVSKELITPYYAQRLKDWITIIEDIINEGITSGEFSQNANPRLFALHLIVTIIGIEELTFFKPELLDKDLISTQLIYSFLKQLL
jgi:TetR/AcrR family fatty acid metabolism transcriptional regulator